MSVIVENVLPALGDEPDAAGDTVEERDGSNRGLDQPQSARFLGKIGPAAKEAVPALEKMRRDGTSYEKSAAAFAVLKITGK